ncbi:fibronectin type III domain-containing protein [Candidatus Microgenomates bacterium]|nr:fibronectin type III domain-containing protein [Candidatus Microgenomates bacterium]
MSYTDFYTKKPKKVPTLLAVLVGVGIMAAIFRFAIPSQRSQATKKGLQTIQITNVFAGQVTIIWKTEEKQKGWIAFGENEDDLSQTGTDERDGNDYVKRFYHYVTLKDLKKDTRYFFKVTDGNGFLENGGKSLFTFKTIGAIDQINNLKPAYGKIIDKSGAPFQDAIITVEARNIYPLSSLSKSTGEWLVPLNYTVDKTSGKFLSLSPNQPVRIHVYSENENETIVTALVQQLSPVEKSLELGQTYSFQNEENVLSATSTKTTQAFDIIFPQANAMVPAQKPLIKGTGVPSSTLVLTLTGGGRTITDNVAVDTKGAWKYDVKTLLEAGKYTLSVTAQAQQRGKADVRQRTFTIAKSGVQVLGEATISGTLSPTASPSPTVDPLSLTPTITPIVVLSSPTPIPPTVIPTQIASTTPPPPVSGGNIYALVLSSVALMLFGAGLMVIF